MSGGVELVTVTEDEAELRLDRWFRKRYPALGHGKLQKLLRTGQVRVDGKRAGAGDRLARGQAVRVPPLKLEGAPPPDNGPRPLSDRDADLIRSLVLYRDDSLIALNKPAGLAVQGGTGTTRHIDGLLGGLAEGGRRPKLVHRLDRDTSGLLVLARTDTAARRLTEAFRGRDIQKLYWAIVVGRPLHPAGLIDQKLAKLPGAKGEVVAEADFGKPAQTRYWTVQGASKLAAWLALVPLTGRTHQLRVHCATALDTPILGDGKYGGSRARPSGAPAGLMLHARELSLPHPDGGTLKLAAPPSDQLLAAFDWLGFHMGDETEAGLEALDA
ncbi:RluA family pseudouridine synthase [Marinivivus vitaminiproducens]|uniref:RluA family pseudouridine synthase n=1 Tax=Marinivivus vitaminiproducens TaxID=3035935 RepID=UPI0027A3E816|nr:RluA family pseudouridine synthase [Geminicoccaceae bacterium SCSIO 64248]